MGAELYKKVSDELCPDGNWQLRDVMKTLLKFQIRRLPQGRVSQEETRYPITPAGMRAFLDTFFAKHYFQVQHSLLDYMTSEDFLDLLDTQELNILDIGSGPAVASLAITDMLACVLSYLRDIRRLSNAEEIRISYVLNDTSNICLGTGQELLRNYFRLSSEYNRRLIHARTLAIEKGFPLNISQLKRIRKNIGSYNIINFSYVVNPLTEEQGLENIINGLAQVETLCSPNGKILILQDKFSAAVIKRVARGIRRSCRKDVLTQFVYSTGNDNTQYTYLYYRCLFTPSRSNIVFKKALA